jgi:hypothetical protein
MTSPGPRHRAARALTALALLGATLAACGPGASSGTPAPSTTAGASGAAVQGQVVEGTSYRFTLPDSPSFTAQPDLRPSTNGAMERRWRYAVRPAGPFCTVVAVEQPHFTQAFPASVIAVFDATNAGVGEHVVRNAAIPPVAGALAGVAQEATFGATLDDGSTVAARVFQRQFLTRGRTLVSVSAAGPQDELEACRIAAVVESLQLTGRELTVSSPPPAAGA